MERPEKQPPDPAYPQRWLRGPLPPVSKILSTTRNEGWTGSRSCAWPPVLTSRKRTISSFWERLEPERPIWPAPLAWPPAAVFTPSSISALPDLLVEISVARANGTYRDYMKKLRTREAAYSGRVGCSTPSRRQRARDVLELVEARNKVASTIFCSQYDTSEWHENPVRPDPG